MAQTQTQDMPQETFLTMSANLLHKVFIESTRTDAKNLYNQISEGKRVALTQVQMEDKSTLRFDLSLEHSEYRGSLNYSGFRVSLATLVGNLVTALQKEEKIPVFNAKHDPNVMMFGVTAVTVDDEQPSVMVLGADSSGTEASVVLRLMYIDPSQFEVRGESGGTADQA